ncbi:MAG: hypothetical protein Q8S09_00360 [Hyphomonas sp.]|nr:hypothetical protein [Hyphomonas sp.]
MSEFAGKFKFDPKSLSTQLMTKASREMVRRIKAETERRLGKHCCDDHRLQTLQTSVIVTGFMQIVGDVQRQTGPIKISVLDQAFRTIVRELTGEEVPQADSAGEAADD